VKLRYIIHVCRIFICIESVRQDEINSMRQIIFNVSDEQHLSKDTANKTLFSDKLKMKLIIVMK
jgi:hypothetical protein